MNQILEFLYTQVQEKLKEDGISIEARNILTEMKIEMKKMLKEELTLNSLPAMEVKLEGFIKQLKQLNKDEQCSE